DAPGTIAKNGESDDHGNGSGDQLGQNGHGERGALAGHAQAGLYDLFEGIDIALEIAGEEFADLLVETVDVGDQGKQAEEESEGDAGADHCGGGYFLLAGPGFAGLDSRGRLSLCGPALSDDLSLSIVLAIALSIRAAGRFSFARNCFSRRSICPLSHS